MDAARRRRTIEQWFVRRGTPHLIDDYALRTDVLTRLAPALSVVFVVEVVVVSFGDRFTGWGQAAAVGGALALLVGAIVVVNRVRGRPPLRRPDDIGIPELAAFVLVAPLVAVVLGSHRDAEMAWVVVANVALVVAGAFTVSYGLVPMSLWALGQLRAQLRDSARLGVRAAPLLLLFVIFVFLSAEAWQVAADLPLGFFAVIALAITSLGSALLALAQRTGVDDLAGFTSWADVLAECDDTPAAGLDPDALPGAPAPVPLSRRARVNVALVLFVAQAIQVVLVVALTFVLLVGLGLLAMREQTIVSWIGRDLRDGDVLWSWAVAGDRVVLSSPLLVVAGLLACLAGLQFAVSLATDAAYRAEFAEGMRHEVRQTLAVRAIYLVLR